MPRHIIIGTAGHIDHGKTALVEALTGVNADRWEEEQRRGITIDIGFAHLDCGQDLQLEFIDVPGHERFIKNMLAGAGGVDLALLVISADESVMPQTREHFDICRLLGIASGVIAVTKSDLVDAELVELVQLEAEEFVAGSFLEGAPVIGVSAKSGAGVDELRQALESAALQAAAKDTSKRFRLPIDRVFSAKGFGAVVTGTLTAGSVETEAEVEVYPAGLRARVRGVQAHGRTAQRAVAGQRTALNLAGIHSAELRRGLTLAEPGVLAATQQFDCRLDLLASAPALKHGAPVHFHAGAAEIEARVFLLDRDLSSGAKPAALEPGSSGYAQVRLREPTLLLPGDRFILRRFSPVVTIGGGSVLDPVAPRREPWVHRLERLRALESGSLEMILAALLAVSRWGSSGAEVILRTGWTAAEFAQARAALESRQAAASLQEKPTWLIGSQDLARAEQELLDALDAFHRSHPLEPGRSAEEVRQALFAGAPAALGEVVFVRLEEAKQIVRDGELVRLASHRIALQRDEQAAREKIIGAFEAAGLTVPALKDFLPSVGVDAARAKTLTAGLLREGLLVRVTPELVFHRTAISGLLARLAQRKAQQPTLSVAEFKDLAGVSRKYAIPLLEYLDKRRITRRQGNNRILV